MEDLELERVGTRTLEEMDALLHSRHTLNFWAEDTSLWYEISYENRSDTHFCYSIKIGTDGMEVYVERYSHLSNLMQYEPFDLSKFKIMKY